MAQPVANERVKYQYTVSPSDISEGLQSDWWKGEGPPNQLPTLIGFKEVGVRAAYTKALYYYDTLVKKWLESFEILSADEKHVIPVKNIVFGTPERLFAVDKEKGRGSMTERVVLPAISYNRASVTKIYDRGPTLRTSRKEIVRNENSFLNYVEIKSTMHLVDLPYQVELWTKSYTEMEMLLSQFMLPFGPQAYFRLIMPEYYFDEVIMVKFGGLTDASALEPTKERLVRYTGEISLQAYLPINVSKIVRSIKDIVVEWVGKRLIAEEETVDEVFSTVGARTDLQQATYDQTVPSAVWTVYHSIPGEPLVTVIDSDNNYILSDQYSLVYGEDMTGVFVTITFADAVPRTGTVYLTL